MENYSTVDENMELKHKFYPKADIPVFQLSVDRSADGGIHYGFGKELKDLCEQGVLIFASGNVVIIIHIYFSKIIGKVIKKGGLVTILFL